jgi:CHAT domain
MLLANLAPREGYQTVTIRIFTPAAPSEAYPVELSVSRWRDFPRVTLSIDQASLNARVADPKEYGLALGQMLFSDQALGKAYGETVAAVQGQSEGLRIRLQIDPPELQGLHWERIYHSLAGEWHPLGSTASTPFSRYIPAQQWDRPAPVIVRPLRILAVLASPSNLQQYDLDPILPAERQSLRSQLDQLRDTAVTYLETGTTAPPTLNGIRKALAEGYHLVHILGHGACMAAGTVLYLEKEGGEVEPVKAERLAEAFKVLANPPLFCFLAACESASRARSDAFVPLGPMLVEDGGVQAVVAMTERVGLKTALQFANQFYNRLLNHGLVDLAVSEARALVQDEWDWGAPVLFSRLPDNQLIDFPVGRFSHNYLSHTDRAFTMVGEALAVARRDNSQQVVGDLERLIKEMSKSHRVLVDYASSFREVGYDPNTFSVRFEDFYNKFKKHYDSQDWVNEDTSCHEIQTMAMQLLPGVRPLLDAATFAQLEKELDLLGNADLRLVSLFREFMEAMNTAVEEIWKRVGAGDIPGAVSLKRDFEAQISPSFRRSKEMLAQMSSSFGHVKQA